MMLINYSAGNQTYHLGNFTSTLITRECTGAEYFSVECLHKVFCPQLTSYFVNVGIILILVVLFFHWFNWWFFNHGYKMVEYDHTKGAGKIVGNLQRRETRAYWDIFIKEKLLEALLLFTAVVVYANI